MFEIDDPKIKQFLQCWFVCLVETERKRVEVVWGKETGWGGGRA